MNNFLSKVNWYWASFIGILCAFGFFVIGVQTYSIALEIIDLSQEFLVFIGALLVLWIIVTSVHVILKRREGSLHLHMPVSVSHLSNIPRNIIAGLLLGILILELAPYVIVPATMGLHHPKAISMGMFTEVFRGNGYGLGPWGDEYYYEDDYYDYETGYDDGYSDGQGMTQPGMPYYPEDEWGYWDPSVASCDTSAYRDKLRLDDLKTFSRFLVDTHYTEHGAYPTSLGVVVEYYNAPVDEDYGYNMYEYLAPTLDDQCETYTVNDHTRYFYTQLDGGESFQIGANLESKIEGALDTGCNGEADRFCYYVKPQQL